VALVAALAALGALPALVPTWDAPPAPAGSRFALLAVGDAGHRPKASPWLTPQRAVGDALAATHREAPVDLLVFLGDNFYPDGLEAEELEPRIAANLVAPYCAFLDLRAPLSPRVAPSCPLAPEERRPVPVRAVLGNHDWRAPESPDLQQDAVPRYLANWRLRRGGAWVEDHAAGVSVVYFDSTHERTREGLRALRDALAAARGPWRVVAAHHPIDLSPKGTAVREALAAAGVPVHLWLAGHEHNLQLGEPGAPGPALQVVAGAGSHPTGLKYDLPGRRVYRKSLGYARVDLVGDADARAGGRGAARGGKADEGGEPDGGGNAEGGGHADGSGDELVVSLVAVRPFPAARWEPARLVARYAVARGGTVRVLEQAESDPPVREPGEEEPFE